MSLLCRVGWHRWYEWTSRPRGVWTFWTEYRQCKRKRCQRIECRDVESDHSGTRCSPWTAADLGAPHE